MNDEVQPVELTENEIIAIRREKLNTWREATQAFPNTFKPENTAGALSAAYAETDKETLAEKPVTVKIAGRIMTRRLMGKASFVTLQDRTGQMQAYVRGDNLPEGIYEDFKKWDMGDIIGIEGELFRTKTNELTVKAKTITLLTKSLRPLPEKYHGLADQEQRYRQRYLDLIANADVRKTFMIRSQLIAGMRQYLIERDFLEVETPMMHSIPGGATARPFNTHHNALDMPLYMRVAPELFLKRLVVGGIERVFEINRNFRNEGISTRHNPEFTMIEFYQAYADYQDLMALTEDMFAYLAKTVLGTTVVHYQESDYDLAKPFKRLTVRDAVKHHNKLSDADVDDAKTLTEILKKHKANVKGHESLGHLLFMVFEETVEHELMEPTFITEHPFEVSPLSRRNDKNPAVVDRFELYIAGREIANAFSELNDPEDQAARFKAQVAEKDAGDDEAMHYDEDYITALEHGMPPTAGEGIGIDRLAMFFTDSPSIRDVILFPLLKPK
ncbi:MAG: lysine--tRNA ligase [marine bacterium B5-7]|nr:MAG: lysine--tRNA ligase [marine bacterium B5-7]